jgi:hypothetical protein
MAYLENNSTETLLLANQEFLGATVQIPADFIAAQVSFNTAGSGGTLEFLHSYNGINFQTYGDSFELGVGEHSKQVSLKAQFFRVKYINGDANQTNFHLHTRIGKGGAFDDMNVITSGGDGGPSIIQGANLDGGAGIDISADTKIQSTETINRLYTHSSLYAEYTDEFEQKSDLPLNCDVNGLLNVNVVGGDSFDGVIKGISKTAPFPAVSISADASNIEGIITNKLYTRSSLYGINETGEGENQLGVNGFGEASVLVKNTFLDTHCYGSSDGTVFHHLKTTAQGNLITESKTHDGNNLPIASTDYSGARALNVSVANSSINTVVDNNVIVSPIVQKQSFDVVLNSNLYADSTGNNTPPFQRDPLGHQGWYYINTDPLKSSNVYYYLNIPALPLTKQSDVLLENINFFYAVITIDYVGSLNSNLPFLVMGSQPLGNETDITPNFMNTRYAYTLPVGITYITGEPIVIYWSDSENKKPLETFMPNLRRIKLNNPVITGTGESTKLGFFSVNTSTEVAEKQEYTLIGAGYKFNSAQGEQGGVLNDATFDFLFTAQTVIENNLAKLTFNENDELLVFTTNTQSSSGSFGNVASNTTLTTGADTSVFSLTDGNYKKDCILTVKDTSITSTGYYSINVSSDTGQNYETLGIVQPLVSLNGTRGGSTTLNLSPYNRIKLTNESLGSYENVSISLYSS